MAASAPLSTCSWFAPACPPPRLATWSGSPDTGLPSTTPASDAGASDSAAGADAHSDAADRAAQQATGQHDPLAALRAAEAQRITDRACARPDLSMHYDESGRFHLLYSAPA
jgi:hypothetical protein